MQVVKVILSVEDVFVWQILCTILPTEKPVVCSLWCLVSAGLKVDAVERDWML